MKHNLHINSTTASQSVSQTPFNQRRAGPGRGRYTYTYLSSAKVYFPFAQSRAFLWGSPRFYGGGVRARTQNAGALHITLFHCCAVPPTSNRSPPVRPPSRASRGMIGVRVEPVLLPRERPTGVVACDLLCSPERVPSSVYCCLVISTDTQMMTTISHGWVTLLRRCRPYWAASPIHC